MKRTTTSITVLLLLAIVLSGSVSAELIVNKYTNSFSASTSDNEQLKLCACEQKVDKIIIENTGNFQADFHVEAQTPYPSVRIPKTDFQLAPGHFQEVLIYIDDSCSFRGTVPYDVVVTNNYGRTQRISRSIRVDSCQTATLDVSGSPTVGLCKPASFDVRVANVGTFADTFTLDFGPYNANVDLANNVVYLQPGESRTQMINVTLDCRDVGTKKVPFILTTAKGGQRIVVEREMTVRNEYDFDMQLPSNAQACVGTSTKMQLTIRNLANAADTVRIASSSNDASVAKEVSLQAHEERTIDIAFSPRDPGQHDVTLTATSAFGGLTKERTMTLTAQNCYDTSITILTNASVPVTAPIGSCCGYQEFLVNVRNNAQRTQVMQLAIDGPSIFSLDETSIRLEPGQNVNVPLRVRLPCSDERIAATVIAWPDGQEQLNATATLVIDSQTRRTCHMVQIDHDELRMNQEQRSIPVTVASTGSAGGTYAISTNSSAFKFEEENVTLLPGTTSTLHLISTGNLSEQRPGRYVVHPMFTLSDRGIAYNEAVGVTLTPAPWRISFAWLRAFTWCTWTVLVLLLLLLVALIVLIAIWAGWNAFPNGLPRTTLNIIKMVLIVLIGILLIVMILFVQPPVAQARYERAAASHGYVIEWYQNQQHKIDVAQYFEDPDEDFITFSVTQPSHIAVLVENNTLTLTPDKNFAGENNITITASDTRGGDVTSPPFTLRVIGMRNLTCIQWLDMWCHYVIITLLILLVLVVFLSTLTIKERRNKPYASNVLVVVEKPAQRATSRRTATQQTAPRSGTRAAARGASRATGTAKTSARTGVASRATGNSRTASKSTPSKNTARRNSRSRALVVQPVRSSGAAVRAVPARGKQISMPASPARAGARQAIPVLREYKASGQTVNIAVAPQQASPTVVSVPGAKQSEVVFIGGKGGDKVHAPYCAVARRIPRSKRIAFSSKREALNAGLIPCRTCRPFEGGI